MNAGTFEELSRQVAGASTRRQALRYFAAAAGTAVFTFSSATPALAGRCRKNNQPCRESAECCSKFCDPVTGRCGGCDAGTVACGGTCVDACAPPKALNPATCVCECLQGTAPCGDTCCSTFQVCCFQNSFCCPPLTSCCGTSQCCSGAQVCQSNDCCLPAGQPCVNDADCCSGTTCEQITKVGPKICVTGKL